jgi:hypothetical protein
MTRPAAARPCERAAPRCVRVSSRPMWVGALPARHQVRGSRSWACCPREHTQPGSPEAGPCRRPPKSSATAACELQNCRPLHIHHRPCDLLLLEINAPPVHHSLAIHHLACGLGFDLGGKTRAVGSVGRLGLDLKGGLWIWLLDHHEPFSFCCHFFFKIKLANWS